MNKVVLMGRLTKNPEMRYTSKTKTPVAEFILAVNRRVSGNDNQPQADFIVIVAWNKTAEFVQKYFTKGMQVAIVGRLQTRTWDDNEGKRHYVTEVVADEAYFADSKRNNDRGEGLVGEEFMPIDNDNLPPWERGQ